MLIGKRDRLLVTLFVFTGLCILFPRALVPVDDVVEMVPQTLLELSFPLTMCLKCPPPDSWRTWNRVKSFST